MIPKKIHYCWLGGNPLSESAQKCIESWKKFCPDYEITEWNESNYDFNKNKYMKEALEAKKWGFVPDYARLDIIHEHGGIYLDVDVEMTRPFDELLMNNGFAGFETERYINLGQGFGAESGNPMIKKLMDSYEGLSFINEDGSLNMIASPELNTEVFVQSGFVTDGSYQNIDGFVIYPTDYFCPKSFNDGIIRKTENTFSIHHFDASWFDDEKQTEKLQRWKEKQEKEKKKQRKVAIKNLVIKIIGEDRYKKLREKKD